MKTNIYNVIILDESGSTNLIKQQAINGYNETIQAYTENQNHFIALDTFDSGRIKSVYDCVGASHGVAQEEN